MYESHWNVVNGDISSSQIVSGNNNITTFNFSDAYKSAIEIQESLEKENIDEEDKESALELLRDISAKIEQNKRPRMIKSALIGLRDFLLDVGANVTAALIAAKIQGCLFNEGSAYVFES